MTLRRGERGLRKAGGDKDSAPDGVASSPQLGINQVYYKRDFPSAAKARVKLNLTGVPKGKHSLELYKVGYRVNDAYATNLDLGSPSQLTKAQVAQIKTANSGAPLSHVSVKVGKDGVLNQEFNLRENDVGLLILKKH